MSFLDNPRQFLKDHAVLIGDIPNAGTRGVRQFRIAPSFPGSSTYVIIEDDGQGESFQAFWVPYRENQYSEFDLALDDSKYDESVKFILTFTLSGCTFAAGSGRRPKVAHINYQNGTEIDQERIDTELANQFGVVPAMTLRKDGYFGKAGAFSNKFTVIGVLQGDEWSFYLNSKSDFANGRKAWKLHGSVDIPAVESAPDVHVGVGNKPSGKGCCTIL